MWEREERKQVLDERRGKCAECGMRRERQLIIMCNGCSEMR
jgi:hypothetical protein